MTKFFFYVNIVGGGLFLPLALITTDPVIGKFLWIMFAVCVAGMIMGAIALGIDAEKHATKTCSHCAEQIKSEAKKCKHCGEPVA